MTNGQKFTPMLKAGGLWAKTSAKDGRYLTGRLGGVKVLILANRDRKTDDDPSHHLFFVEAPDRRQGAQQGVQERSGVLGHPRSARGHQRRSAGASRRRRRSTTTMHRSGRDERGEAEEAQPASARITGQAL